MNRLLAIPAACCLVAFAGLLAALQGTTSHATETAERIADNGSISIGPGGSPAVIPPAPGNAPLSDQEAQAILSNLANAYLGPWRQMESSPHEIYSRAGPRRIPSISAQVVTSPSSPGTNNGFLLGTITIATEGRSQAVPCIVDRVTKRISFFMDGQWISEGEWLKKAPRP